MVGGAVDIIRTVVFALAILWVLSQLVVTRRKLRTGQVVIPSLFAAVIASRKTQVVVEPVSAVELTVMVAA